MRTKYTYIDHILFLVFIERWYSETPLFHYHIGETSLVLDDVSCLLNMPLIGLLLDHSMIYIFGVLYMMVEQFEDDP